MYINKIDQLLDKILDDYYMYIVKNEKFQKIARDDNFVKYQSNINSILQTYITSINKKEIRDIVNNEDNVDRILELLKRYLGYYTFMTIGFFYNAKSDTYNNNIVEFSKNQGSFNLNISSFFNSESNSNIIVFFNIIKQIQTILELESSQLKIVISQPKYKDTFEFLNKIGKDSVESMFRLKNLRGNKRLQSHNIVKTLLIVELYLKQEKQVIYDILESVEKEEGEYIFIDIVIPKIVRADFNEIENILTDDENKQGISSTIYQLLIDNEDKVTEDTMTVEWKILQLINENILTPIVDDFLLYHKDVEKYEKFQPMDGKKKKEDTKIKYIINKIDITSDYYSNRINNDKSKRKLIKNNFNISLLDRKAITVNDTEEINMINKLQNIGKRAIENNEYYNDLQTYRKYPYINFKDFKRYGFPIKLNKTIPLIRNISFELLKNNKRGYSYEPQLRIGTDEMIVNIVGFMVHNTKILECLSIKDIKNIRGIKTKKSNGKIETVGNGYNGILKYIQTTKFKNKILPPVYWKLDLEKDRTKSTQYEMLSKISNEEHSKLIISLLYDNVLNYSSGYIMNIYEKKEVYGIYDAYKILEYYRKKLFDIPKESNNYNEIEKIIFTEKYEKAIDEYDKTEDNFPGIVGKVINLPIIKKEKVKKVNKIIISEKEDILEQEKVNIGNAICQHFVSWDNITETRKKNPNKYTSELTEFIYKYVIENKETNYICKSCGTLLNIKTYVAGGVFDNDSGKFTTFSTPIETPIEEIYEYRNLRNTIRNIDKLIERVASISNITYYVGNTLNVRSRRNKIVKDVIDLITLHNKNMSGNYKKRNETIQDLYGIDKNISNMFIFDLDDSIFTFTTKETDYYKLVKQNNILSYIIFLMVIDLSKSQILYLMGNKACNYYVYKKFGIRMFDNLNIISNDNNDTTSIKNYDILCYILYYISCLGVRYKLWNYIGDDEEIKKKQFSPVIQKTMIQTTLDIINSIIEINLSKNIKDTDKTNTHYIYGLISGRFFNKLQSLFQDREISNILDKNIMKKIVKVDGKTKIIKPNIKYNKLDGFYKPMNFGYRKLIVRTAPTYYFKTIISEKDKYRNITNVTNCPNGLFHNWESKGQDLICSICNVKASELKVNIKENTEIVKNYINNQLQSIASKYCKKNMMHLLIYSSKNNCQVCSKCDYIENKKLTQKELLDLQQNITSYKQNLSKKIDAKQKKIYLKYKEDSKYIESIIKNMKESYNKTVSSSANRLKFIDSLIYTMQNIVGESTFLPKSNKKIYISEDVYFINHDKNGTILKNPLIIKPTKIHLQKNNKFFQTDVIYYTDFKQGRVDIYYDALNKNLLGYKEEHKNYVLSTNINRYIRINYSIKSKLMLMGYTSKYINISSKINSLKKIYKDDKSKIKEQITSSLNRDRIISLKRLLGNIQRNVYRLGYKYKEKYKVSEYTEEPFIEKYRQSLGNMRLTNDNKKQRAFKHWEKITTNITYVPPKTDINIDISSKYIEAESLSNLDYHGNLLLYYITNEMKRLISYNKNRFVKTGIIQLLIEIISQVFDSVNIEYWESKTSIKQFKYALSSSRYQYDIEKAGHGLGDGVYGEYKDIDEADSEDTINEKYENRQEAEALDIDMDLENETDMIYDGEYELSRSTNFIADESVLLNSLYNSIYL